jgi:hypothetical protein
MAVMDDSTGASGRKRRPGASGARGRVDRPVGIFLSRLFRRDGPRAIDWYIDYFGGEVGSRLLSAVRYEFGGPEVTAPGTPGGGR